MKKPNPKTAAATVLTAMTIPRLNRIDWTPRNMGSIDNVKNVPGPRKTNPKIAQ